jgi:hypothetical protein
VDFRAGLDDLEKRKFLTLPGRELRPLGRPASSQSLYRLRYPGCLIIIIIIIYYLCAASTAVIIIIIIIITLKAICMLGDDRYVCLEMMD